jgi:LacI family transcriptional regulator
VPLTLVAADFTLLVSNAVELLTARIENNNEPPTTRLLPTGRLRLEPLRSSTLPS